MKLEFVDVVCVEIVYCCVMDFGLFVFASLIEMTEEFMRDEFVEMLCI